jgi:hypothetical protein
MPVKVVSWIIQDNPKKEEEFLRMVLKASGFNMSQVASINKCSTAMVSYTIARKKNSPSILRFFESIANKLGYGYSYYMDWLSNNQDLVK